MSSPWIFGIWMMVTACGAAPAKAPLRAASRASVSPAARFPDAQAGRVRSRSLDLALELMLPEKASWRVAEGASWLEAEHAQSASKLALRTWRAERLVRRADCEAQARLARPTIPIENEESIVDRRTFTAPAGFDSELVVGVEPSARGVLGFALVFGASVGYCYAAVFTTTASGGGSEENVAARLGVAVDRILSSVRARSVDERAVRHRLVVGPKATQSESK